MEIRVKATKKLTDAVINIVEEEAQAGGSHVPAGQDITIQVSGSDEDFVMTVADDVCTPAAMHKIRDRVVELYQQEGWIIDYTADE